VAIPLSYSIRNLRTRRLTTVLTVAGMALVVAVFSAVLMLAEGLRTTLVATGSFDNVVVLRKGAISEVVSGIDRQQAAVVETQREVASGPDGRKLVARELTVLIALPKRSSGKTSNVILRGVEATSLSLRPQVRLVEGRLPRVGSSELMVGSNVAKTFDGTGINQTLCCGLQDWRVVGIFDAGATGFSSEIWGDVNRLMQAFTRFAYSSVIFKLADASTFPVVKNRIEDDPRLTVQAKRETVYYEEQSRAMATFLRILGLSVTIIFSLGAVIGAMVTMYAAVANRTAEIGTLRAIGFQRFSILVAFLMESLVLGFLGGAAGLIAASVMQFFTVSTLNFQSFSELAFSFTLTPSIAAEAVIFALIMGFTGGVLPAVRASRMKIVDTLRAA